MGLTKPIEQNVTENIEYINIIRGRKGYGEKKFWETRVL